MVTGDHTAYGPYPNTQTGVDLAITAMDGATFVVADDVVRVDGKGIFWLLRTEG